jgi:hypothetical protein
VSHTLLGFGLMLVDEQQHSQENTTKCEEEQNKKVFLL